MTDEHDCARCREVLKMLIAHTRELEHARQDIEDGLDRLNDASHYVHTMARVLRGEQP